MRLTTCFCPASTPHEAAGGLPASVPQSAHRAPATARGPHTCEAHGRQACQGAGPHLLRLALRGNHR